MAAFLALVLVCGCGSSSASPDPASPTSAEPPPAEPTAAAAPAPETATEEPVETQTTAAAPGPAPAGARVELPTSLRESGDGEFDPLIVIRMLRVREPALRSCYERALAASPGLAGAMTLTLTIEPSGQVVGVGMLDGSLGPDVDLCAQDLLRRFRFNPGPDGGSVTYDFPLRFSPAP